MILREYGKEVAFRYCVKLLCMDVAVQNITCIAVDSLSTRNKKLQSHLAVWREKSITVAVTYSVFHWFREFKIQIFHLNT